MATVHLVAFELERKNGRALIKLITYQIFEQSNNYLQKNYIIYNSKLGNYMT